MTMKWVVIGILIGTCTSHLAAASTNEDFSHLKSALPSPVTYYSLPDAKPSSEPKAENVSGNERDPRFGVQLGYGNDLQGYSGGQLMGSYTPLKIDLGGLVLGTVIGLGVVLLAPKLLHVLSPPAHHPPGPYAKSVESEGSSWEMMSSLGSVIGRVERALGEPEDTTSCLQRAACSLASTAASTSAGKQIASSSSFNPVMNFFLDGSKLKAAMDVGLKGEDCAAAFPNCNLSNNNIINDNKL